MFWCLRSRVVYLQVSMNEGLSFITSSVHITTTECVSLTANTHPDKLLSTKWKSILRFA